MNQPPPGVLFVCLGNICRSPTAEYVARAEFARLGLRLPVASRGLGNWHVGQGADPRTVAAARAAGYDLSPHRARQFDDDDFERFARVLAVDRATLAELQRRVPRNFPAPERLLVAAGLAPAMADADGDVPDPYTGTGDDFRNVLTLIRRGVEALALRLTAQPATEGFVHAAR
jgi:protein-tyrosine phosphatase